ncbi:hypothetical protein OAR06_00670, partial [Flavobacteriaceae bacterium]|nr:hypothetical protein [Flavobacteriaceae bacterium]
FSNNSIKDITSDSCLTNERAIQSTFCLAENTASLISLSVSAGCEIFVFGRLNPLFEKRAPP